jgi:hypothetical protein
MEGKSEGEHGKANGTVSQKGSKRTLGERISGATLRQKLFGAAGAIFVAAAGAVLAAWLGGLLSIGTPVASDSTQQLIFQPWETTGAPGISPDVRITSRVSGYCWRHSNITDRPDAYRCIYGNALLDPCISNPYEGSNSHQVACSYPDPSSVVLITLTQPLPSTSDILKIPSTPWFLVLDNGEKCAAFSGGTTPVAGLSEHYYCGNAGLYGNIRDTGPKWTIFELTTGAPEMVLESISMAYF